MSRVVFRIRVATLFLMFGFLAVVPLRSADSTDSAVQREFQKTIRPFLTTYCFRCHGTNAPAAQFDMRPYSTIEAVVDDFARWRLMSERLSAGQMPPATMPQPPAALREQVVDWIQAVGINEARKHAGDPGRVPARRLSNAEYNNTIRDLTGVDIQPAREFPVDPANTEGFDNSGESLTMSPSLFNKYLQAARQVSEHMLLKPDGIDFAPSSDVGGDRSRSLFNQPHPRVLCRPAYGCGRLLRSRVAIQAPRRARTAARIARGRRCSSERQRQVPGDDLEPPRGAD